MAKGQKVPETTAELAEQLTKLFPPDVIERLNMLAPHIKEQVEKAAPALSALAVIRADDYKVTYSDLYRSRMGTNGFTLLFARMTHLPSVFATANSISEEAEVTMGWSQTKMLAITLGEIIAAFEEEIGTIPIPVSFQSNLEGQRQAVRGLGLPLRVRDDQHPGPSTEPPARGARGRTQNRAPTGSA